MERQKERGGKDEVQYILARTFVWELPAVKCVTDESIRVCHVTDTAELRQTVCHHRDQHFPKGTAA